MPPEGKGGEEGAEAEHVLAHVAWTARPGAQARSAIGHRDVGGFEGWVARRLLRVRRRQLAGEIAAEGKHPLLGQAGGPVPRRLAQVVLERFVVHHWPLKFPGSKLLHNWDLSAQHLSLNDLLRSCQQIGLTGFAEVKTPTAVALIFYYLGGEVNALYREGEMAFNGGIALEKLRAQESGAEGEVSVYELPLDMAHLLRGTTNRQKLPETVRSRDELAALLARLQAEAHTGTLELQGRRGAAMVLLVNGRASNIYWETTSGQTFEKAEARSHLDKSLDQQDEPTLYLSDFSRDAWKSRHEVQAAVRSRLETPEQRGAEALSDEETALRQQVLGDVTAELPAVVLAFMFDLLTGAEYARKTGKATSELRVGLLASKVPGLTRYVCDLVSMDNEDEVELVEITTDRIAVLVAIVPGAAEAVGVLAEKAQPTELIGGALSRIVRGYAARLAPFRGIAER
jgi:hypothetical protein